MIGVVAREEEHDVVREFFELFKTPWEFYRRGVCYQVVIDTEGTRNHHSATLVIVYGSGATAFDDEAKWLPGSRRRNTLLSFDGDRIPVYGDCVSCVSDGRPQRLVLEDTGEAVVCSTRMNDGTIVRVGYDLFWEVRVLFKTGQPPVHAAVPTLERHIAFLRSSIVDAGIPLVEIPPVPEGYRFIVCLTHDVDHPSIRLHRLDRTMFGFLYRAVVGSVVNVLRGRMPLTGLCLNWLAVLRLPFVHLGLAKDFWSQFDRYLEIEKGLGSTFFVIPVKNEPGWSVDGQAPRFRGASYGVADIADQVRGLRASGSEIGLHGIDAWLDSEKGAEERECVSRVAGALTQGVRMHWLFFDEGSSQRLDEAGFTYDSTFGYNETVGFRAGTMQAFKPLTSGRLLELPLTIMDTALFYPSHLNLTARAAKQVVGRLIDDAERYGGVLVLNWHDRSLAPERLWGEFYAEMVEELKCRGAWFPTATQAVSWFLQRRSVIVDSVRWEGTSVRIRASADRPEDLPGLTVRVHRPGLPEGDRAPLGHPPSRFTDVVLRDVLDSYLVAQQ